MSSPQDDMRRKLQKSAVDGLKRKLDDKYEAQQIRQKAQKVRLSRDFQVGSNSFWDADQPSTSRVSDIEKARSGPAPTNDTLPIGEEVEPDLMAGPDEINLSLRSEVTGREGVGEGVGVRNICTWNVPGGGEVPTRQPLHVMIEAMVKFGMVIRSMACEGRPVESTDRVTLASTLEEEQTMRRTVQEMFNSFEAERETGLQEKEFSKKLIMEDVAIRQIESVRDKGEGSAQMNTSSAPSSPSSSSSSSRSTSPSSNVSTTSSGTSAEWDEGTGGNPAPAIGYETPFAELTDGEGDYGPGAERININKRTCNGRPDSETDVQGEQSTDSSSSSSAQDSGLDASQEMDYTNGNVEADQDEQSDQDDQNER